jgi:DNA-binding CsgD family transcriptional regulator
MKESDNGANGGSEASLLELVAAIHFNPLDRDPLAAERHRSLLETLSGMDGVSVALFDLAEGRYRYMKTNFKSMLSLPEDAPRKGGLGFFRERLHLEDKELYFQTSLEVLRFLLGSPAGERKDYRTYIDFRILDGKGAWIRLAQQNSVLETDASGLPWLVLTYIEPSKIKDMEIPLRRSLKRKSSGDFVLFPESDRMLAPELSPRELEILGLVSKGFSSSDIARLLSLSLHTVNTHRRNILGKLEVENASEAVRYAADRGLV